MLHRVRFIIRTSTNKSILQYDIKFDAEVQPSFFFLSIHAYALEPKGFKFLRPGFLLNQNAKGNYPITLDGTMKIHWCVSSFNLKRFRQSRLHKHGALHFLNCSIKSLCNVLLFHKPLELIARVFSSTTCKQYFWSFSNFLNNCNIALNFQTLDLWF